MKNLGLALILVVGIALTFACKSQPAADPPQPTPSTEDALKATYDRYRGGLILDGAETYTVVHGDTLNGIARVQYSGDGFDYPLILLASSDIVADEDKIVPGMELTIPDLQRNLDDATARAALKNFLQDVAVIEDQRNRSATAEGLRAKAASL